MKRLTLLLAATLTLTGCTTTLTKISCAMSMKQESTSLTRFINNAMNSGAVPVTDNGYTATLAGRTFWIANGPTAFTQQGTRYRPSCTAIDRFLRAVQVQ